MNALKRLLDQKGITPYLLAKKSGVNPSIIYRSLRNGLSNISMATGYKIAKTLGVSMEELYELDQEAEPYIPDLEEGWNDINRHFAVFVEDGKLMRGLLDHEPVRPYLPTDETGGTLVIAEGAAIEEWPNIRWK